MLGLLTNHSHYLRKCIESTRISKTQTTRSNEGKEAVLKV